MFKFTPLKALLAGGLAYGTGAYWMFNHYYERSTLRSIYVGSDPNFATIKVMQPRDMRTI